MSENSDKAKVYKANFMLQQKVGAGPLDEEKVHKMQNVIDNNEVDFTPLGMQFLEELEQAVKTARDPEVKMADKKRLLTEPVMQLKANAAIFHFTLIGNLANVMLSFLESINNLDDDAIEIVNAHHKTLYAIVIKKMKGDGGQVGATMISELKDACARYYAKKKAKSKQ